ncbi:MAG: hypothetical protein Q4D88_03455 [Anaerococcus sp.]|nr:hypothetical protein [Anaerococcus sp.]
MKTTVRFLTFISGLFRSIITILFLFASIFTGFADEKKLASFLDLVGFTQVSLGLIKPIAIVALLIIFAINLILTKNIFLSGKSGQKALANLFFGLLFMAIDGLVYIFIVRERLIFFILLLNGLLVFTAILTLAAKARGLYKFDNPDKLISENESSMQKDSISGEEIEEISEDEEDLDGLSLDFAKNIEDEKEDKKEQEEK